MRGWSRRGPVLALGAGGILLLWATGFYLRLAILVVPPLIPRFIDLLHLGSGQISVLVTLPLLLLAVGTVASGQVLRFLTPKQMIVAGLILMCAGSISRTVTPGFGSLIGATIALGLGIAAIQMGLPIYIQVNFPKAIGRATAIYTNALLFGELVAAGLTLPLVHALGENHWRLVFVVWTLPALLVAASFLFARSGRESTVKAAAASGERVTQDPAHSSRSKIALAILRLGLLMGGTGSIYFTANTFIPVYLHAAGKAEFVAGALAALNGCQLVSSALLVFIGEKAFERRAYFSLFAILALSALCSLWFIPAGSAYLFVAGICGFSTAGMLTITLGLPAKAADGAIGRYLVMGSLGLGYFLVFAISSLGGAVADWLHRLSLGIAPAVAMGCLLVVLSLFAGPGVRTRRPARRRSVAWGDRSPR